MSDDKTEQCLINSEAFGSITVKSIETTVGSLEVLAILPAAKF